jgi:hypothetical protein
LGFLCIHGKPKTTIKAVCKYLGSIGNLAEYSLSHRFLPPPATLPHERLAAEVSDQEDMHREASTNSLERMGAELKSHAFFH